MLDRVLAGESITITRSGKPVADLVVHRRSALAVEVLLDRWRHLPHVDPQALRSDIDAIVDARL